MKNKLITVLFFVLATNTIWAQMPSTQIYLLNVQRSAKKYKINSAKLISFKEGYNNQPFFSQDGRTVLFCATNERKTAEIYAYDIEKNKTKRLTKTSESEYSPRYTMDGENISCVRVEDDTVTQNFVLYSTKGKKSTLPLPRLTTIGYYSWINMNEIAAFVLPEPTTLLRYNLTNQKEDTLAKNIGRSVVTLRGKIFYTDKTDSNNIVIRQVSREKLMRNKSKYYTDYDDPIIVKALSGEEDFTVMTDGTFLMGHEGRIYSFNPRKNKTWVEVANLKEFGIDNFYRIATSNDNTKIAVVVYKGSKP